MNQPQRELHPRPDDCPLCAGTKLVGRHCKLICPACGYIESCEDLFPARQKGDAVIAPPSPCVVRE